MSYIIKKRNQHSYKMYEILKSHFVDEKYKLLFDASIYNFSSILYTNTPNKFNQLQHALSNIFLTPLQKEEIIDIFCKMQRFIHAMYRIKNMWLLKKTKQYNTEDLYMNPIQETDKNVVVLIQNNTKYLFHLRELMNTIQNSLANCVHFFAESIVCKNPYTNLPFNKSSLYTIYFLVKSSSFLMPVLFHKYFLCDFDLITFSLNNEYLVNDEYLGKFVENNCQRNILYNVREMFLDLGIKTIRIHDDFPKNILYNIMKPYLDLYYNSQYSMNLSKKEYSSTILKYKLQQFCKYNPKFGRKHIQMVSKEPFVQQKYRVVTFNDNHLAFYDNLQATDQFMKTHLYKRVQNLFPGVPLINVDHLAVSATTQMPVHLHFDGNSDESDIIYDVSFNINLPSQTSEDSYYEDDNDEGEHEESDNSDDSDDSSDDEEEEEEEEEADDEEEEENDAEEEKEQWMDTSDPSSEEDE